jgi:hypothetical protein
MSPTGGGSAGSVTAVDLTILEAQEWLDPPLSAFQLRMLVRIAGLQPTSHRRTGRAGRPFPAYPAVALMQLHAAIAPVLAAMATAGVDAEPLLAGIAVTGVPAGLAGGDGSGRPDCRA